MDSRVKIYMERADNEILAAQALKILSENAKEKGNFELPSEVTFYSSVISHTYYAIFYAARAALLSKGIQIIAPYIHNKAYTIFGKTFVDTGLLDKHLLEVYESLLIKASDLLQIFKDEKWKRGNFTYKTIPQANKEPAEESLKNAKLFVSHIRSFLEKS